MTLSPSPRPALSPSHRPALRPSRRQILRYTLPAVVYAVAGPTVLAATARAPKASAEGLQLIDFAVRQVSPEAIKAAGYDGV